MMSASDASSKRPLVEKASSFWNVRWNNFCIPLDVWSALLFSFYFHLEYFRLRNKDSPQYRPKWLMQPFRLKAASKLSWTWQTSKTLFCLILRARAGEIHTSREIRTTYDTWEHVGSVSRVLWISRYACISSPLVILSLDNNLKKV